MKYLKLLILLTINVLFTFGHQFDEKVNKNEKCTRRRRIECQKYERGIDRCVAQYAIPGAVCGGPISIFPCISTLGIEAVRCWADCFKAEKFNVQCNNNNNNNNNNKNKNKNNRYNIKKKNYRKRFL